MVMADKREMNLRKLFDLAGWWSESLGACELNGRCSCGKDRIDDEIIWANLDDGG